MLRDRKVSKVIVTKHEVVTSEVVTRYEIFCETERPFIPDIHLKGPTMMATMTSETPLKLLDRFAGERKEMLECIYDLKTSFSDLEERQINFVQLKSKLIDLRNKLTLAQSGFLRFVNMCIDSLENTRAELMSKKQLDALESVIKMTHEATEDFEVNLLQEILINSGLKPIPDLEGIAELY